MIPIMTYTFDIDLAAKYGVNEAIMLNNFIYWIAKNEANGKHFYDGRYWTYNSVAAFVKLFPFWSNKQIRTIIASLERQGVLMKGNYNEQKYDRTCWYAFTDGFAESIFPNGKIDLPKTANGISEKGEPIPDNKNHIEIPYNNTDSSGASADAPASRRKKFSFRDSIISDGASADQADRLLAIRKQKRLTNSEAAYSRLHESIQTICNAQGVTTAEVVAFMLKQGWGAIRPDWSGVEGIKAATPRSRKVRSLQDIMANDTRLF